jgi:sulfotransferase
MHFIACLPRSGSTLLAGITGENARFHAGMTSPVGAPVGAIYVASEAAMSRRNETAGFIDDEQRRAVLKALSANYYQSILSGTVIFDTYRVRCAKSPALGELFPVAQVICRVERTERRTGLPADLFNRFSEICSGGPRTRSRVTGPSFSSPVQFTT